MKPVFERVLVALDLSPMDDKILRLTAALAPVMGMKKIYFLHVASNFSLPENIEPSYRESLVPFASVDEQLREKIAQQVAVVFKDTRNVDFQIEVVEGKPFQTLLHWLDVKDVDLLVAGRKSIEAGSGITARRLARHSACNVLFVPDTDTVDTQHILAPIDFSPNSARSMEVALSLAKPTGIPLNALYVIDLPPSDYYMRNFDTEAFRQVLRQSAHATCKEFMQENSVEEQAVHMAFIENVYANTARHIEEYVQDKGIGFIVLGAQGHAALQQLLFGSVTEKVVDSPIQQAILVIR